MTKDAGWIIKIHGSPQEGGTTGEMTCAKCGCRVWETWAEDWNFCPRCGDKKEWHYEK